MTDDTICDFCERHESEFNWRSFKVIRLKNGLDEKWYDVCPDCYNEIWKFIKNFEPKIKKEKKK